MLSHSSELVSQSIDEVVSSAIADHLFPGAMVALIDAAHQIVFKSFGHLTYDDSALVPTQDTLYDVASVTKTVATAATALKLIDQGQLALSDKVQNYLPELNCEYASDILVWHLLTFTVPFALTMSALKDQSAAEIKREVLNAKLLGKPGSEYAYLNATSLVLGWVIEAVTGYSLDQAAAENVFKPLGMTETTFWPDANQQVIAPTEFDSWRNRLLQGEIHDESAWKLRPEIVAGSAGLFSTAADLGTFLTGFFDGDFLSKKLLDQVSTNQTPQRSFSTALGWELNQRWMGVDSEQTTSEIRRVGKTGFTGCAISYDVEQQRGLVLLTNLVHPHRPVSRQPWLQFLKELHGVVYGR